MLLAVLTRFKNRLESGKLRYVWMLSAVGALAGTFVGRGPLSLQGIVLGIFAAFVFVFFSISVFSLVKER